ncbi:FBP domain-containing protein [Trebonia kvetii]|uniref:FBP domain-containing protein n=1 Tax=Trebonia kvetii TaxID=2480626 RepID=UPI00319E526B
MNCTKGEAKRLNVPRDLAELPWEDLDFLGWRDQQSPERAYLVAEPARCTCAERSRWWVSAVGSRNR